MKEIKNIIKGFNFKVVQPGSKHTCTGLAFDSRKVEPGFLFIAIKGTQTDGHQFIQKAIEKGAVAIICEELPNVIPDSIMLISTPDTQLALAYMAGNWYDHPSQKLKLTGVTGTNGKTTTATLLCELFESLGYRCGLLSTVENRIHQKVISATHTTPDPLQLNALLAEMVEEGCDYAFMEVSSHAIVQHRVTGLHFAGGIFTNLTHDHLDYHKTFTEYLKAKKGFFDALPPSAFALINADDKNGEVMIQNCSATKYSYSLTTMADFHTRLIENHIDGLLLRLDGTEAWFKLVGEFNAYNLTAIYGAAVLLGQNRLEVLEKLSAIKPVEGRFDTIRSGNGITAIVDYAHTPDALKNVISTINSIRKEDARLITVAGAGGDRDRTKRPVMAKIAAENSDQLILTSDNPRTEDPEIILEEMRSGLSPALLQKTITITNRHEAIRTALALAHKGDIVLVAGKGHEKYQEINGIRHHFDDKEEINKAFGINV